MPCLIVRGNGGNGGNGGGIETKLHVGMISLPEEAEEEGWLHGLWKFGFLGSEDALALAGDAVD